MLMHEYNIVKHPIENRQFKKRFVRGVLIYSGHRMKQHVSALTQSQLVHMKAFPDEFPNVNAKDASPGHL